MLYSLWAQLLLHVRNLIDQAQLWIGHCCPSCGSSSELAVLGLQELCFGFGQEAFRFGISKDCSLLERLDILLLG